MITIVENIIPTSLADEIESITTTREFPWYYAGSSSGVGENYDVNDLLRKDSVQHIHNVYDEQGPVSDMFSYIKTMLYFLEDKTGIKIKELFRVKINSLTSDGLKIDSYNSPHVDHSEANYMSMVYYINDCDGDTVIFDKTVDAGYNNLTILHRIKPKKGSCVIFPSNQFHSSSNPRNYERRLIINFTFKVN